jgi:hypothetical protein
LFQIPDAASATTPTSNASTVGQAFVNNQIVHSDLADTNADLFNSTAAALALLGSNAGDSGAAGNSVVTPIIAPGTANADMRQHPYFRTEMMQKMMNLTTTRTHQFAVWVTVGFFEVTAQGNAQTATPDTLGAELNLAAGENQRYRAFFIVDRSRAIGFNCPWPGVASNDFRDCVLYRRQIE